MKEIPIQTIPPIGKISNLYSLDKRENHIPFLSHSQEKYDWENLRGLSWIFLESKKSS